MKKIVVTGGTGVLGSALVNWLTQQSGVQVVVVSRNRRRLNSYSPMAEQPAIVWQRVDLLSGEGLAEALFQADTVVHLAKDINAIYNRL